MPASNINYYNMQDAKNNLNSVRPLPIYADSNIFMNRCQNIHVSTNCYYGVENIKAVQHVEDCEMEEMPNKGHNIESESPQGNARKRSADDSTYPKTKRIREEVQTMKNYEPETNEKMSLQTRAEDLMESLYWSLHGGTLFSCYNSD